MIEAQLYSVQPKTCADCPLWQNSDRTPNCGNCAYSEQTTLGHEPASEDCWYALSALAELDRPTAELGFRFNPIDRYGCVFEVWQRKRYLGRIERLYDATWLVSRVDNKPHSDGVRYVDRDEAATALRSLVFRANALSLRPSSVFHDCDWAMMAIASLGAVAIGMLSFVPSALAYRGSGRDLPPPPSNSQTYQPPNNGGPSGTTGSGTR